MTSSDSIPAVQGLWTSCSQPRPQASLRLFCFPYAGAGSSVYNAWSNLLWPEIELYLIHLPGRDRRIRETAYERLLPLVETLTAALRPSLDKPFAFFGHSMGALISFEVARQVQSLYSMQPVHLFVSGHRSPHLPNTHPNMHHLPDEKLLLETERLYSALPAIVLQDSELLQIFLPIMRADLTMLETYQYAPGDLLECPISVFGGVQDNSVHESELSAWRQQTMGAFNIKMFPGNHFFIHSESAELIRAIKKELSKYWQT